MSEEKKISKISEYKAKAWCFTSFAELPPNYQSDIMTYLIYGSELCPETQRRHWQSYVEFAGRISFAQVQQALVSEPVPHIERRIGTSLQALTYCKKGEQSKEEWLQFKDKGPNFGLNADFKEFGTPQQPGERTDIVSCMDAIKRGASKRELYEEHSAILFKYPRAVDDARAVFSRQRDTDVDCIVFWLFGPSGTGKTRFANEILREFGGYRKNGHNAWWDDYDGEELVLINEYRRTAIPYAELLEILDRYPLRVQKKHGSMQLCANVIIITSEQAPRAEYSDMSEKEYTQLRRRIITVDFDRVTYAPASASKIHPRQDVIDRIRLMIEQLTPSD